MSDVGRFILTTGRAGSNMLTRMLAKNEKTLVLSDFLGACDNVHRFEQGEITGERFAQIIGRNDDLSALLRRRQFNYKELLTDVKNEHPRWGHPANLPVMMVSFLPFVEPNNPEALYDEMIAFAKALPTQRIGLHYEATWAWITEKYGKEAWVERTGSSIRFADEIIREFPKAKYLHLHRDGVSAALSMLEHAWFVLAVEYDMRVPNREEIRAALDYVSTDPNDDVISRLFHQDRPSLAEFGRHWSWQITRGYREFIHLDRHQFLAVSYEDLLAHPERELKRIGAFYELPEDEGWEARAVATINPSLGQRPHDLQPEELAAVREAVLPGQMLIGREDPTGLPEAYRRLRAEVERPA
jgi:Sulfotransferase family